MAKKAQNQKSGAQRRRNRQRGGNRQGAPRPQQTAVQNMPRQQNPLRLRNISEGFDFVNLDRETIRISHAYVAANIYKDNHAGVFPVNPFGDPSLQAMMRPYTRFRYRAMSVTWLPAVSQFVSGIFAIECTAATAVSTPKSVGDVAGSPGAAIGPISSSARAVCDVRSYQNEWYYLAGGKGDPNGTPNITWAAETASEDSLGYFIVSYVAEFTAPVFNPMPNAAEKLLNMEAELKRVTEEVRKLSVEIAESASQVDSEEREVY